MSSIYYQVILKANRFDSQNQVIECCGHVHKTPEAAAQCGMLPIYTQYGSAMVRAVTKGKIRNLTKNEVTSFFNGPIYRDDLYRESKQFRTRGVPFFRKVLNGIRTVLAIGG